MTIEHLREALDLIEGHRTIALSAAGLLMVLLSGVGWWVRKRLNGRADLFGRFCDNAAIAIAIGLSAEGMWEVATEGMGFGWDKAILLFAFAELAMLRAARRARRKVAKGKSPGVYGVLVWSIALGAATIAALNAPNAAELGVRLAAPTLVAAQWWADLLDELRERRGGRVERSSWIWTPRRVGIHLGLLKPGEADDLSEVFRRRDVDRMVRLARQLDTGWGWLAGWREGRLRKLAEVATAQMLDEVRERHQRGATVRAHIFAQPAKPDRAPVAQEQPTPAPVALPQVARLAARVDAPAARRGQVVLRRPAEVPAEHTADEREAALLRAVARARGGESVRGAAKAEDVPESTLRTRLKQTNGHSFELAVK